MASEILAGKIQVRRQQHRAYRARSKAPLAKLPVSRTVHLRRAVGSVMCQLLIELNYRKSRANYRHIVYVWSTDRFTERGRAISGRNIEAYPPVFDFTRFLDFEALSKAIYHSLGCK